ncbi:MAG: hypothetical protein CMI53_00525 [Parcubacteria group bacterium]|jgi:hypothetical protein|nr:hypothetical protein [Parcubacteria group bacterium]|tara:strand:- start:2638 stop:3504 length:867 start_codon:yes stop_codon:yes gene_type:complete
MTTENLNQPNKVSNFQLKISYWYVTHKLQLRRLLVALLVALIVALFGFSIFRASIILFVEDKELEQTLSLLTTDAINYEYFHEVNKPRELKIVSFDAVDGREKRFDFIAQVQNSNEKWVATDVLFQLISGGKVIAEKRSFVYPNETKFVAIFGQEVLSGNPVLRIADVKWRRYLGFNEFAEPRLRFVVGETDFKAARESGIKGELPISTLNFEVSNKSGFSYWQTGIYIVLLSGQKIVAANYTTLDQFLSGETRTVEMRWYESLPTINEIQVLPEVDILDITSYMRVE